MTYFRITNSEDGVRVRALTHDELMEDIREEQSDAYSPEHRPQYVTEVPDEYTATNKVCIVRGEIITPKPVETVTEWTVAE